LLELPLELLVVPLLLHAAIPTAKAAAAKDQNRTR
jgi:hypothetical protein